VLAWHKLPFPNLLSLTIEGIGLKTLDLGEELPVLQKLRVDGYEPSPTLQLKLPNLKELVLGFLGESNKEMTTILRGCPQLQHLHSYKNRGIAGTLKLAHEKLKYLSLPRAECLRVLKVYSPLDTLILHGCFDLRRVELLSTYNKKQLLNPPSVKVDVNNCNSCELIAPIGRVSEVHGNDSGSDSGDF